jgi:glycosyltransferase involved in cell wall biosynthesis
VIPAFNVERYLPIALQSVRAQTLQPAEIIVVDDGSQDGTRAVAEAAGVRVVAQPNSGLSAARNAGVAAATQPWIAFLDADDRWEPEKLERQWKAVMASHGVRFFATDSSELSELTGEIRTSRHACHAAYQFARKEGAGEGVVRIDRDSLAESLPLGQYLTPSTWLVDRDLLVSERFDCTLPSRRWCHVGEDYDWLLRALIHSDAIVVESPLTEYRVRPGSLSHSSGRTRAGDVALGKMVCSRPEAYLDGAARMFASLRARHVEIAAQEFLRVGDGVGAGIVLNALEPSERSPRWYAYRLAATMTANRWGEEAARRLRSVKRVLAR